MVTTSSRKISVFILLMLLFISGCSSSPNKVRREQAIESARAVYAGGAIQINLNAEPMMNAFNNTASSCKVVIIQSHDRQNLNDLLKNPASLHMIFSGASVREGILQVDNYTLMPGQSVSLHIDRVENSRYVAIVAGYYPAPDKNHSRIYSLPISVTQQGWLNQSWTAQYLPARISITLGRNAIVQSNIAPRSAKDYVVYAE